jgi:DNA repair ATPase RecN
VFSTVHIRNWQSLRSVDLDLGRFTVIVGASSSGKSAFMRALRAVTSTATGTSAITRGADTASISVTASGEGASVVTLEHVRGSWRYRMTAPMVRYRMTGPSTEAVFTKLNRSVPEQITAALRIAPGSPLNFAGQFDRPYLLTESGASVARELGELTNVDVVFEAVREANRRKSAASGVLRTRRDDLARVSAEAQRFADLPARLDACTRAEAHAEVAHRLHDEVRRLSAAIDILQVTESVLAEYTSAPPLADIAAVDAASAELTRFVTALRETQTTTAAFQRAKAVAAASASTERELSAQYQQILVTLGTCPTCEQRITP